MVDTYAVAGGPTATRLVEGVRTFPMEKTYNRTVRPKKYLPRVGGQVRPEKVKSKTPTFFDGRHLCRSWGTTKWWKGCSGANVTF